MNREFNGRNTVYGVIGDPISHSFSPQIHGYFAELSGINMAYLPFHVKSTDISDAIRGAHALGIRGLNVTVPHKQAVLPHLTCIDPMAQKVGTVNTLLWRENGYIGYNTDYLGIQHTLSALDISFAGNIIAVLGAGGTAYAACVAAADQGAKRIIIINRTRENAVFLASHVSYHYNIPVDILVPGEQMSVKPDIVVQTTTIGFGKSSDKSPILSLDFFSGVQLAFDVIYSPWETIFLKQAKEAGVQKTINGFPMLVYQAAEAFMLWQENFYDKSYEAMEGHIETLAKRLHVN